MKCSVFLKQLFYRARNAFPVTSVRQAVAQAEEQVFADGDPVEVYYQPHNEEPCLWFPAVIDKCKVLKMKNFSL